LIARAIYELLNYFKFSLKRRGLFGTIKIFYLKMNNRYFDWRYDVDTASNLSLRAMDFKNPNKPEGVEYGTIPPYLIKKILDQVNYDQSDVFLDFGCGKGRVLLIASEYKFKKIIGIEFSPELAGIALKNILSCRDYNNFDIDRIKIIEKDVLDYKYNNDETVFYLYNPFSNIILDQLCGQIVKSIHHKPRRVYIIYVNPIFANIIISNGFNKINEIDLINKMCFIYSND